MQVGNSINPYKNSIDIKTPLANVVKESFNGTSSLKDDKKILNVIDSLPISNNDKSKLKELVKEIKSDSNSGFLKSSSVGSSELKKIQAIANSNPLAKDLLSLIEPNLDIRANRQHSSDPNKLSFGNKNSSLKNLPGYTNQQPQFHEKGSIKSGKDTISNFYSGAYIDKNCLLYTSRCV